MRLAAMVKYLLVKKLSKAATLLIFFFLFFCFDTNAQKYRLSFNNLPLSEVLLEVSRQFNVKVAFDAGRTGSVIITREVTGNTPEEFLTNLLETTGFQFQYKHGNFLIIPDDSPSSKPKECQLLGSIMDKESGEQLPFASICILNQHINTFASENGSFSIKNIVPNPMHLVVSFIGYQPIDTTINWDNTSLNCDFKLSRKAQKIDSVLVKANKLEMVDYRNDVDFVTTINATKLIDLPVFAETDIFKTLQLLPGIKYSETSSELSIRGGTSDQNLVLYDGQTLYNLSHYFGVFSSINPNIIKDIQIYKGGYDSRYGERVSGIIDITGKSGNQMRPVVYGDINFISANLGAEIPIGKKVTLLSAVRRSYADIYSTSLAKGLFEDATNSYQGNSNNIITRSNPFYYFYDFSSKLTYRINNRENLSISYYGGKDYFDNDYSGKEDNLNFESKGNNTWSNYGLSASWLKQWNNSFYSNLQVGASGYNGEYSDSTVLTNLNPPMQGGQQHGNLPQGLNYFDSYSQNKLTDFSLSLRNTYYVSSLNQLSFGFSARRNSTFYYKDANRKIFLYEKTDQAAWLNSVYGQDRITLFSNLTVKPGFRASYYQGNNEFYFEPRFSASYRFNDKISCRIATGLYYQFISQVLSQQETGYTKNFWILADDSGHPVVRSVHYIAGGTWEMGNFLLDAEGYYKSFDGIQEYLYVSQYDPKLRNNPGPQASYYVKGSGKAYGVDFLLRYKLKAFTSWVSYSLGHCYHQYPGINAGNEIPAPTDQPQQVSFTNMLTIKKWNFSTTTLFSSGRPYFEYTLDNQHLPTIRNYKRLSDYFRTDLSVNYNFIIKGAKLKLGATIINLFNTNNYYDVSTRKFDYENTSFMETNLIRSQPLSFNLFLHFVL